MEIEHSMENIKRCFSKKFHNYLNVFYRSLSNKLSLQHSYDHEIDILDNFRLSESKLYHISLFKFGKVK